MTPLGLLELREEAPRLLSSALANGGDFADLFAESGSVTQLVLQLRRGRRREHHDTAAVAGYGLRVVSGSHSRLQTTGRPGESESSVSAGEMKAMAEAALDGALSLRPDLSALEVRIRHRERHALIAPSDLPPALTAVTWTGIRVEAQQATNGRMRTAQAIGGGPDQFLVTSPEDVAKECVARLEAVSRADSVVRGEMPVVIAGGWGGAWLHEAVGHLLEGDVAGSGPYAPGRIGEQVAAQGVTIVDGVPTETVDEEGIAALPTTLIRDGMLTALMTDRVRARSLGMPLTGNGYRQDYRHQPLPRMRNLYLEAGQDSPARLVEDVSHGLFVRMITHGRVHPTEDRFSFDVAEGYCIENGRLGRPVTGVRVSGSASNVLFDIAGIGDDLTFDRARGVCVKQGQTVFTSVGMPTILVGKLTVEPIAE